MLAKFVPDLHRVEPRNIGVVVWDNGRVSYRFLGAYKDRINPPKFVPEDTRHAYREWITFWRTQLRRDTIRKRSGARVKRDSPEFLEVLSSKSKPSFMLVEAAKLFDSLNGHIADARDEYFAALVASVSPADRHKHVAQALKKSAGRVIREVVVSDAKLQKHVRYNVHVSAELEGGGWVDPVVNTVFGNGKAKAVLQPTIPDHRQSVANTAWAFRDLQRSKLRLTKEQCAAIVDSNLYDPQDRHVVGAINGLGEEATIIDVADHDRAFAQIEQMAALSMR
jgi:hypothetical protein